MTATPEPLAEALRLQLEAARLGFDWRHLGELWDKLAEETVELQQAAGEGRERAQDELGDLLFMVVNLARHLGVDASAALTGANAKFSRRFSHILQNLEKLPDLGHPQRIDAMEAFWQEAKRFEKT
ncbi:MAG TPA: MazG nucleotide pyrophosphohydrolase domain-containing protein [Solimonas sp.]|nr:MazG nucleotide pyrophosphohydrolase domain-containing protein [Solimonas sp.]